MRASLKTFAYLLAFTCLVLSCTFVSFASTSGKEFFKSDLSRGEDTFTFRPFVDVSPAWNFWGVFAEPLSFTGGTNLYVFPDGRALFTKWCDICSEEILAKGSYKFSKGKLTFFWESKPRSTEPPKIMYPMYGQIERSDFVTGFAVILLDQTNLNGALGGSPHFEYLWRNVEYHDWKKIYVDLAAEGRAAKSK